MDYVRPIDRLKPKYLRGLPKNLMAIVMAFMLLQFMRADMGDSWSTSDQWVFSEGMPEVSMQNDCLNSHSFTEAIGQSLLGDVYAHPAESERSKYGGFL